MRIRSLERQISQERPSSQWLSSGDSPSPAQQNQIIRSLENQLSHIRSESRNGESLPGVSPRSRSSESFLANARKTFGEGSVWSRSTTHLGEVVIQRNDIPLSRQNIQRMKDGNAPFVRNSRGDWEPLVLHHVGRKEGGLIEVTRSQNRYDPTTGGPLHIPGPGGPVRQDNFTRSYWQQRVQDLQK